MTERSKSDHECRTFTEFLLGERPTPYVLEKYFDANEFIECPSESDRFERILMSMAERHHMLTRLADSYARWFAPSCLLRKKLVVLFAILEVSPPHCYRIGSFEVTSKTNFLVTMSGQTFMAILWLLASIVLLFPVHLPYLFRK